MIKLRETWLDPGTVPLGGTGGQLGQEAASSPIPKGRGSAGGKDEPEDSCV